LEQSVTGLQNKYNTRKRQGIGRVCKMVDNTAPADNTAADFPDQLGDFALDYDSSGDIEDVYVATAGDLDTTCTWIEVDNA